MSDHNLLDPSIFATLKSNLEEETQVRDSLTQIVQRLERAVAVAQGHLSRVHSTPRAKCELHVPGVVDSRILGSDRDATDPALVQLVEAAIGDEVSIVEELNQVASKHPYYKYVH